MQNGTPRVSHRAARREWCERWATAIREARTGLSQTELAARLDVGQSTVAMWEAARSVPEDLAKIRVIAALDLDAAVLFRPLDARTRIGRSDR